MNLSVLHVLAHLILSAALQNITVIITPVLKRRKLSQSLVKWYAQGHTAMKGQSWDLIHFLLGEHKSYPYFVALAFQW